MKLSILGHSTSRLGLGDRHHRHLPRHDLAVCRGWRLLSAAGRTQGPEHDQPRDSRRVARATGQLLEVLLILTGVFGTISGWASGLPSALPVPRPPAR